MGGADLWGDMPSLLIAGDHRPHQVVEARGGHAGGESQLRRVAQIMLSLEFLTQKGEWIGVLRRD